MAFCYTCLATPNAWKCLRVRLVCAIIYVEAARTVVPSLFSILSLIKKKTEKVQSPSSCAKCHTDPYTGLTLNTSSINVKHLLAITIETKMN